MLQGKLSLFYRVNEGAIAGTIIEPLSAAFVAVQYPHRKTKDLYIPPIDGKQKTWHCCQEGCPNPDFETSQLLEHLETHAGRLIKKAGTICIWLKKVQRK